MPQHKSLFFLIILVTFVLIAGFLYKEVSSQKSCNKFDCLKFPGKENWKIKDTYSDTKEGWRGMIAADGYSIRLSVAYNLDSKRADDITKTIIMETGGLFDTAKNPYAGAISDKIVCSDSLKPVSENITSKSGINILYTSSYLNDRLQYGACTESQIAYKVYSGILYCSKSKEWFEAEVISSKNDTRSNSFYRNLFMNTGCK